MESQHSAVQHEDLTPIDAEGGFVMEFNIDIVEDVPAEVENVMHLATVGLFTEAREAAKLTVEHYLDNFPVLIEFLRLLYDQGDYHSLRDHVNRALTAKWDNEQSLLLSLFEELTFVHSYGYSHDAFQRVNLRISVVQKLNSTALEAMNEEQILAISLMLRLKYLRYSFRGAIPATNFVLWSTKRKEDAPYAFIEHLLRQENYWAAVNALEVCLRKANKRHYTHNFARLWKSIEPFATRTCANDPEEVLWATTDLLQTFCEGLLRRTATQIKPWESATKLLSNMRKMIEEKCDAKYTWSNSRSFRRQELIKLDKAVITKNQFRDLEIDEDTVKNLLRVRGHAEEHQDVRLLGGIRWRIGVLIQGIDPTKIPTPPGSIPYEIYEKRHKLILQANKTSKGGWFPRLGALWESLCDEHARGQDLFSDFSGENPNIAFSPGPPKPVKRVLLLGHTGAGKSTLFRTITGAYAPTSDAPIPCTVGIQKDRYHWQHCILECIDTPGFGDSRGNMSNDRVLSGIAEFLKKEYLAGRRIHTVLYLIDVSKNRIDESASRQAKVFEALMGHDVWSNVCFIFTHGVSKHDQGPGAELNAQKQLKFKKELQTVTLRSARKGGAVFSDLGLDFDNHASEAHEKPGQNHTETITKETQSVANADDTNEDFLDFSSDGQEDSDDNRSNAGADGDTSSLPDVSQDEYHPADTARVNAILQKMIGRPGPIVLECQREMVDLGRPFRDTQAALLHEGQTRDGLAATRAEEAQIANDRRAAEETQERFRKESEELRKRLRAAEEEKEKEERRREAEAERQKRWEAEQAREAAEARLLVAKESEQLMMKKTQVEQERKAQAYAVERENDEIREKLKREEAARLEAEHRAAEERKARVESEQLRREFEQSRREEEAARAAAEDLRARGERVKEAREMFKREIEIIESSSGWASRFIIHNDTQVDIHVRARHVLPPVMGVVANYENNVRAGRLRAVHCGAGKYEFQVFMGTPNNGFTTGGQVSAAIGYGVGNLAVYATAGVLGACLGPLGLAASAGLGVAWGALLNYINDGDPDAVGNDYTETGFESHFKDGEDNSIMIASKPQDVLMQEVELQMLVMEATRKGTLLPVATSADYGLWKTTRLTISGGPVSTSLTRKDSTKYRKYTFTEDTEPITVDRVASFEEDD